MGMNQKIYQELKSEFNKQNDLKRKGFEKYGKYKILIYWIILFIIFLPQIVLLLTKKPYEYIEDLDNLPEPIQTEASWWTVMAVHWMNVQIDFLAKYDISWKIISIRDYMWVDTIRELWPRDFTIWWWKMWKEEYIDKFNWNDMRDRFIYYRLKDWNEDWFKESFWWDRKQPFPSLFLTSFSNNHPIPANKKIKRLMKKIKEWDVVRLQWYLIYAHRENGNKKYWRWPSSLVRDDTWGGACEIIYITDVARLKEK